MRVYILDDLLGRSVATTSTCTTKLDGMMKLELVAKVLSKQIFRTGFSVFRRNNYLLTKLEHRIFRETMVFARVATAARLRKKDFC